MSADKSVNRLIRVEVSERPDGRVVATSPTIKGLFVTTSFPDQLDAAIKAAIRDLYLACGERVIVTKVTDEDDAPASWVALNAEMAAAELRAVV